MRAELPDDVVLHEGDEGDYSPRPPNARIAPLTYWAHQRLEAIRAATAAGETGFHRVVSKQAPPGRQPLKTLAEALKKSHGEAGWTFRVAVSYGEDDVRWQTLWAHWEPRAGGGDRASAASAGPRTTPAAGGRGAEGGPSARPAPAPPIPTPPHAQALKAPPELPGMDWATEPDETPQVRPGGQGKPQPGPRAGWS